MVCAQVGGDRARVWRPLAGAGTATVTGLGSALVEVFMIRERSFVSDLRLVLGHAERLTGCRFEVFRADTGRPAHFTLSLVPPPPRAPVLFHAGQVGYVGYLSVVAWRRILGDQGLDVENHSRRICLRLLADHLLCLGRPAAAIAAIARAKAGLPPGSLFEGMRQLLPAGDAASFEAATFSPEHYFPLAFQGLAHEFAHHIGGELRERIEGHRLLTPESLAAMVRQNIEFFEAGRESMPVPSDLRGHEDEFIKELPGMLEEVARRAGGATLREEIIADLGALPILWNACLDAAAPLAREPLVSCHIFATQMMLAKMALMITHFVELSSRRFEESAIEPPDMMEVLIGISTRFRVIMELLLRDGGDLGWLGIAARTGEGDGLVLVRGALEMVQAMFRGALAADESAKSSDFVDAALVREFVDDPANLSPLAADNWAFWRLADDLRLRSPELDLVRERRPNVAPSDRYR